MEQTKQAVENFVTHKGEHKTIVEETIEIPITHENIHPHQHETITTAINKEIHQDHYRTIVQPIKTKETLAEQHVHNIVPVEHRTFEHDDDRELRANLGRESAKYKDTSVTHTTSHSSSTVPIVSGEITYHHIHEHIQPVLEKEIISRKVVHTTVPIHETHHATSILHETTVLPVKTLKEYKREKGVLEGQATHKVREFEGLPDKYSAFIRENVHLHTKGLSAEKV